MEIAIHLGAHCTDEDLLLRTLADNGALLDRARVHIPAGNKARPVLRRALQGASRSPTANAPDALVDDLLRGALADRMVLSYEGFLGTYATALAGPRLYPDAGDRCRSLCRIFDSHDVSFFLAVRNLATFVPALFQASSVERFEDFMAGHDLGRVTWSEPVSAIREACPEAPLTLWCNEDLPLIWPDVLQAVSEIDDTMKGQNAILRQIMTREGFRRMDAYLQENPAPARSTWRKVVTAFLAKYADEAVIEPEIALPGWTGEMIAGLSDLYERDVARLKAMEDVTFIAP
ncbi:hypothetical protein MWU52_07630 [Jannaschia sp. S6380]|uniref:hypothetical protein n=1 Tax=Jannaschia sp. S6380 TaxID=2926408 RepID=UPI001FF212E0|nr:hypothetical protein [Jannaschia sp. S6380]MCK0167412.1 hypothetical protein [Jannaschia sp. S6380]